MIKFPTLCSLLLAAVAAAGATPSDVNDLAGLKLFDRTELWRESPEDVGGRLRLKFRSDGGGDRRVLSASAAGRDFFECPAAEVRIFAAGGHVSRIDLVLLNKGDNVSGGGSDKKNKSKNNAFRRELAKYHAGLERLLRERLGRARKLYFGSGNLSRQLPAWGIGNANLILDYSEGEYLIVRIVPTRELGDHRRRAAEGQRAGTLDRYAANVVREKNGDVYIGRVPMVDQGSKGYCVPATVERVARYFGITDIDMHKLAEKFHTAGGGGTTIDGAVRGTRKLLGEHGLRMKETTRLRRQTIIRHIDQGIPLLWFHFSTADFKSRLDESLAARSSTPPREWAARIAGRKKIRKGNSGAHVALLVGYNPRTGEIAVSNSWGERYNIAWVGFADMEQVDSRLNLYVVTPRGN